MILMLFIIGGLCITAGYAHSIKDKCEKGIEVKYVSRDVYDEIMLNKVDKEIFK